MLALVYILALVLVAVDSITAFFVFRLHRRMSTLEITKTPDGTLEAMCIANARAISKVEEMAEKNTTEIRQVRTMGNANQTAILSAIQNLNHDLMISVSKYTMPREVIEIRLRDLENRIRPHDPDITPSVDADIP